MHPRSDATELLLAWSNGDESAFDRLVPLVYQELRVMAQRYMTHERRDHPLQATALVNEALRQSLAEDADDLTVLAARAKEPRIPFEAFVKDLKKRGKL